MLGLGTLGHLVMGQFNHRLAQVLAGQLSRAGQHDLERGDAVDVAHAMGLDQGAQLVQRHATTLAGQGGGIAPCKQFQFGQGRPQAGATVRQTLSSAQQMAQPNHQPRPDLVGMGNGLPGADVQVHDQVAGR